MSQKNDHLFEKPYKSLVIIVLTALYVLTLHISFSELCKIKRSSILYKKDVKAYSRSSVGVLNNIIILRLYYFLYATELELNKIPNFT